MKVITKIEENETKQIEDINDKKIALENLIKAIDINNDDLYAKILRDYQETMKTYNDWWYSIGKKYSISGEQLSVNFSTNEIVDMSLVKYGE